MLDPSQADLTMRERWILNQFRRAMHFTSATYFFDDFWQKIILPMTSLQSSVKHAALALGGAYAEFSLHYGGIGRDILGRGPGPRSGGISPLILSQSNKSMTYLLQQPAPTSSAGRCTYREIVMATCTVLVLLGLICNDLAGARIHLHHGLKVMKEWESRGFDNSPIGPVLQQTLGELLLKYSVYSNPSSILDDNTPILLHAPDLQSFDVETARYTVDIFWSFWSWLVLQEHADGFSTVDHDVLGTREFAYMYKVRIWEYQLTNYVQRVGYAVPRPTLDILSLLGVWRQVICIKVGAVVTANDTFISLQMGYDAFWAYFQRANELARELLDSLLGQGVFKPCFPIDAAVMTPLFFCGLYCREWTIRRVTLGLLQALEKRFKATSPVHVKSSALRRLIDIESEGLQPGDVVPESARIQFAQVRASPAGSKLHLRYLRSGREVGFDDFDLDTVLPIVESGRGCDYLAFH